MVEGVVGVFYIWLVWSFVWIIFSCIGFDLVDVDKD